MLLSNIKIIQYFQNEFWFRIWSWYWWCTTNHSKRFASIVGADFTRQNQICTVAAESYYNLLHNHLFITNIWVRNKKYKTWIYFLNLDKIDFKMFFHSNPYDAYYKILLSCSATNILRLHQRLPRISFSREFLAVLIIEDSFHYLMYSFIFQYVSPVTCKL